MSETPDSSVPMVPEAENQNPMTIFGELVPDANKGDDTAFAALASAKTFLPRVQLMSAKAPAVSQGFPINHYALIDNQQNIDLGSNITMVPVAWRPKALRIGEETFSVYDPKPDEAGNSTGLFKEIEDAAKTDWQNNFFGPEFLIWLPDIKRFAIFFTCTTSLRVFAPSLREHLGINAVTLGSRSITNKKGTWQIPTLQVCSHPVTPPDKDRAKAIIADFMNPKEMEVATKEETSDRAR